MAKKRGGEILGSEGETFGFVPVNARPCGDRELFLHLDGFVRGFVARNRRGGWLDKLGEYDGEVGWRPKITRRMLDGFYDNCREEYCEVLAGRGNLPVDFVRDCGKKLGVFWKPDSDPCLVTAAEAGTLGFEEDAVFSLEIGRLVLVFNHENFVVRCVRDSVG